MAKNDDEIGYAEALAELEKILSELERADVDVDVTHGCGSTESSGVSRPDRPSLTV